MNVFMEKNIFQDGDTGLIFIIQKVDYYADGANKKQTIKFCKDFLIHVL